MPMPRSDTERDPARINLSQSADELAVLLASVRTQESYLHACQAPYFDQTMGLSNCVWMTPCDSSEVLRRI